jgi:transcriptional regulator with XRE-family HTH domain
MTVAVYPRLGALLQAHGMSVAELERRLRDRFGIEVNSKTLYRLAQDAPIQRADLEIAGATAALLGVGLDDLFTVRAVPVDDDVEMPADLSAEENMRLAELFARQAGDALTDAERRELDALVAEYGRRLHDRQVAEYARRHTLTIAEARRRIADDYQERLAWWRAFEADPGRRRAVVRRAKRGG